MAEQIRVLQVDSDTEFTARTAAALERAESRLTVTAAQSVREALERLDEDEYYCVLSAYNFPNRTGLEFFEAVDENHPNVPFVLLTGGGNEAIAEGAMAAGVTDYVQKDGPVTPGVLANRIVQFAEQYEKRRFEQETHHQPKQLLEYVSDAFLALDTEWRFTYANETAADLFERSVPDLLGESIWEVAPEAVETPFYEYYHEAMEMGEPRTFEEYYEPWERWYREHVYPTDNGLSVVFRDITERKERERERKRFRERMELALDRTDSILFEVDLDSGAVSRYGQFEHLFDLPEAPLDTWQAFATHVVHPEHEAQFREVFQQFTDGNRRHATVEFRTRPAITTPEWIQGDIFVEEDADVHRVIGLARDVTEQKRYEQRLDEEQQFVRSIFESLSDPLYALGTDGYLLRWNETLEEVTGYTADEMEDMYVTEFFPDEEVEKIEQNFRTVVEERRSVTVESAFETKFGERVPFEFTGSPLEGTDGMLRGVTGVGRDISGRKRREDRMAGLNAMLVDFLDAETTQTVCTVAIEAAQSALSLPVTMIALFDDDRWALQPTAQTPSAETQLNSEQLLQEDSVTWRTFMSGESTVIDAAEDSGAAKNGVPVDGVTNPGAIEHLAVYPLGKHGVIVVAGVEGESGVFAEDFVQTVSTNVRDALDRIEREELLVEREELLENHNEQLELVNRINTIIRNIDRTLVAATSRSEIEQAVCEKLAGAGLYRFAWIGEYESTTNTVMPRTYAGADDAPLDVLSTPVDDATAQNPTVAAIHGRDVRVVDEMRSTPPYEPWRAAALRRGYRSAIAAPVVYRGRLYGVLTLYTDRSEPITDLEREVLDELGDNMAHAISAIESRHALVSEAKTELELRVPISEVPLLHSLVQPPHWQFNLDTIIPVTDGTYRIFFTVESATLEDVKDAIEQSPYILEGEQLAERDGRGRFECLVFEGTIITWLLEHGAALDSLTVTNGSCRLTVHIPEEADVRTFVESFQSRCQDAELVARRRREHVETRQTFRKELDERLTPRQQEVLLLAHASGYFESPRERTASEIADVLGITQPTFTEHLRAGERKLLDLLYTPQ